MKKQNGFKTWFAGLKAWQRFILIIAGLAVFSIIGSIAESEPVEDTSTKQEDKEMKSNDKSKTEQVDQETVEKEVEQTQAATEESDIEQEDYTAESETTESDIEQDSESDIEQSEEEYFANMESYFDSVSSAGRALASFGEELTTGEVTPAAEEHIQRAADEMDIASYLISEEGMVNEVPDNLKAFHSRVVAANELYVAGIAEMKDGAAISDIDALESGLQKISEANELSADLKSELEG